MCTERPGYIAPLPQTMIGQWAVALASYLVKKPQQTEVGSKKKRFGDTAADIAETYHFLHKVNMACECVCVCVCVCCVYGLGTRLWLKVVWGLGYGYKWCGD